MHPFLNTSVAATRKIASYLLRQQERFERLATREKNQFVSNLDTQLKSMLIDSLQTAYPTHAFSVDESSLQQTAEYHWIINPLNGVHNYVNGLPHFCITIAITHHETSQHSLIYDPIRDELFTASFGQGARLNNHRLRVTSTHQLDQALVATDTALSLQNQVAGIRCTGSTALDLAYLAAGRLDACWHKTMSPFETAAGLLFVTEAGGLSQALQQQQATVAATPKLLDPLLVIVKR